MSCGRHCGSPPIARISIFTSARHCWAGGNSRGPPSSICRPYSSSPTFWLRGTTWGALRFELGDFDGAIECFREIVRRDPGSVHAQSMLARALEKKKEIEAGKNNN